MNEFMYFTQIFKMPAKNGRKTIFGKKSQMTANTLRVNLFAEIALSHTISEINVLCVLQRHSRWPQKMAVNHFGQKVAYDCI